MTFLTQHKNGIAIRNVDLSQPIQDLTDIGHNDGVRFYLFWQNQLLAHVDISNNCQAISAKQLIAAIQSSSDLKLASIDANIEKRHQLNGQTQFFAKQVSDDVKSLLAANVSVSVVVATYDRPDDLRNCLTSLMGQKTTRQVEIIVVDNHPASGLTPPVVAEFSDVVLVNEPRQGLAYARNAGFVACQGDIAITTDDDVIQPSDWLEKLIQPLVRDDVMAVTGNTLPLQLDTMAQCLFERYGGLGRGCEQNDFDHNWFRSFHFQAVPTWQIGATANAAFRTSIFNQPEIGLMDEALGPGMPSGVGEDTYLFYRILKAGYTITYEPQAYVWHKHRRTMPSLRRQIYGYSKGHIAYHLTTLIQDRDFRALPYLFLIMPARRCAQLIKSLANSLLGIKDYSPSLLLLEIKGNLAGPSGLWRSRQRVKCEGRSEPYKSAAQLVNRSSEYSSMTKSHHLINISETANKSSQI